MEKIRITPISFLFHVLLNNKQKKLLKIKFTYLTDNILSNLFNLANLF